jgi:hypothetical protein
MQIFGKTLSEYVRFEKVILLLILVVGIARLALSLGGVPNSTARWVSITAVSFLGLVYVSITVHTRGFGSYKQLLPLVFIQTALAHLIVVGAIVLAIQTGKDNIFSAPEFSPAGNGKTWGHVVAHLIAGFVILPLLGWLIGSVLLFVTKKVAPQNNPAR